MWPKKSQSSSEVTKSGSYPLFPTYGPMSTVIVNTALVTAQGNRAGSTKVIFPSLSGESFTSLVGYSSTIASK